MKKVAFFLAIFGLSACSEREPQYTQAERDVVIKSMAEQTVRNRLRDPDSAEFGDVVVSRKNGGPVACGVVNSKNGFGGKTGNQRFVATGELAFLEEEVADGGMDQIWKKFC